MVAEKKNSKESTDSSRFQSGVFQALALTTTISMELAITVVLGYYGGSYLDKKFHTDPWLMLAGILTGVLVGIVGIVRSLHSFFTERK